MSNEARNVGTGREQSANSKRLGCLFLALGVGAIVLFGACYYVARHHHGKVFDYALRERSVAPIRLVLAFHPKAKESQEAAHLLCFSLDKKDGFAYASRLLAAGLDANQESANCGALALALNLKEYEPLAWLIDRGADPGRDPAKESYAPLHVLCRRGVTEGAGADFHLRVAELFVASGANVNAPDASGRTPLAHAVRRTTSWPPLATEWWAFVERLMELGADPALLVPHDQTRLMAMALEAKDDAAFLRIARAGLSLGPTSAPGRQLPLPYLVLLADSIEPMELLIERGFDVHGPVAASATWLHAAVYYRNAAAVELLLRHGADPNAPGLDGFGSLRVAYDLRDPEIAKLLLDAGADPNVTGPGEVPLLAATLTGKQEAEFALLLIAAGADPNRAGRDGATPLSLAASGGQTAVVAALLAAGADPSLRDGDGRTPLDLAKSRGHAQIVEMLEAAMSDELASGAAAVESTAP